MTTRVHARASGDILGRWRAYASRMSLSFRRLFPWRAAEVDRPSPPRTGEPRDHHQTLAEPWGAVRAPLVLPARRAVRAAAVPRALAAPSARAQPQAPAGWAAHCPEARPVPALHRAPAAHPTPEAAVVTVSLPDRTALGAPRIDVAAAAAMATRVAAFSVMPAETASAAVRVPASTATASARRVRSTAAAAASTSSGTRTDAATVRRAAAPTRSAKTAAASATRTSSMRSST
jgi:hypothetical protein